MIETFNGDKKVSDPTVMDKSPVFGVKFNKTQVDKIMLDGLEYTLNDKGLNVYTDKGIIKVTFNPDRFRPAEVPIMLSDTRKIQKIGVKMEYSLKDIISAQLDYLNK
jgi:GDPmannose 4,6-dehydratase